MNLLLDESTNTPMKGDKTIEGKTERTKVTAKSETDPLARQISTEHANRVVAAANDEIDSAPQRR